MRKEEIIDFYKFGFLLTPSIYEKFDGDINNLSQNESIVKKIFNCCNPFEYSVEYYLLHLTSERKLSKGIKISIFDVKGIYALDDVSFSLGLMFSPPIKLLPPIWKDAYREFLLQQAKIESETGINNIEIIFAVDFTSVRKDRKFAFRTKKEQRELISDVLIEKPMAGDHSIWYYLLRYERHQNYPKDRRGSFLDVLHVFVNFTKKTYVDTSLIEYSIGKEIMKNPDSIKYNDIVKFMKSKKDTYEKMDAEFVGFFDIALLYLILKSIFQECFVEGKAYEGNSLEKFVETLKTNYDQRSLFYALYLLGFVLGRELTYKYVYLFKKLPILKSSSCCIQ